MPSILDIIIRSSKTGSGGKEAKAELNGLTKAADALKKPLAGAAAGIAALALVERLTAGVTVDYARTVRDLSRNLNISTDETSRLIQVSDDYNISQETLTSSLQMAVKNGFEPTIENLADLADKYNAANGPVEKANLLVPILGKNWAALTPMLAAGGAALRENAAALSGSLILTQQQVDAAREYELALDGLKDSLTGVQIALGNAIIPTLTKAAQTLGLLLTWNDKVDALLNQHQSTVLETAGSYEEYVTEMVRAKEASGQLGKGYLENTQALIRNHEFTDEMATSLGLATTQQFEATNTTKGLAAAYLQIGPALYNANAATQQATAATLSLEDQQAALQAGLQGQYGAALDQHAERLAALTKQYDLDKNGVISIKEATSQYTSGVDASTAALQRNINQLLYQQAAANLSVPKQIELAHSMKLLDEPSYKAAIAQAKLTEALHNHTLTADEYMARTETLASDLATYGVSVGAIAPQAQVASDAIRYMNSQVAQTPDKTVKYDTSSIPGPAQVASDAIDRVNRAMALAKDTHVTFTTDVITNNIVNYSQTGVASTLGTQGYIQQHHAQGGRFSAGNPFLMDENLRTRPEVIVPDFNGQVLTKQDAMAALGGMAGGGGGGGGGGWGNLTINVNAPGATLTRADITAAVKQGLDEAARQGDVRWRTGGN